MLVASTTIPVAAVVRCFVEVASLIAVSVALLIKAVPMEAAPKFSVESGAVRR